MRYQGGKARFARLLAEEIWHAAILFDYDDVEDRFCGGLAVALACRRAGLRVIAVEDGNPALVACYRAIVDGWQPPEVLTREDYAAIKARDNAADPVTAFALGFCSFGGKWGAGIDHDDERWGLGTTSRHPYLKARKDLLAARSLLCETEIREGDCLGPLAPRAVGYFDPVYEGTLGYPGAPPWNGAKAWAAMGRLADSSPVLVSEGAERKGWSVVWEHATDRPQFRKNGAREVLLSRGLLGAALADRV